MDGEPRRLRPPKDPRRDPAAAAALAQKPVTGARRATVRAPCRLARASPLAAGRPPPTGLRAAATARAAGVREELGPSRARHATLLLPRLGCRRRPGRRRSAFASPQRPGSPSSWRELATRPGGPRNPGRRTRQCLLASTSERATRRALDARCGRNPGVSTDVEAALAIHARAEVWRPATPFAAVSEKEFSRTRTCVRGLWHAETRRACAAVYRACRGLRGIGPRCWPRRRPGLRVMVWTRRAAAGVSARPSRRRRCRCRRLH
jgi:hypothetical protein